MVTLDGVNTGFHKITINGAWITYKGVVIRGPEMYNWFDEKHRAVMVALEALENALEGLSREIESKHCGCTAFCYGTKNVTPGCVA